MHREFKATTKVLPLSDWTVVNLRASTAQVAIRRIARRYGAQSLALPGFRLEVRNDGQVIEQLRAALSRGTGLFVSPMAVRACRSLLPESLSRQRMALAVGAATAKALRLALVAEVRAGHPETSEGLLALPELQAGNGRALVMIGAPDGRGLLAAALKQRGFVVDECDVYARVPVRLDRRHWAALSAATPPLALMLSSEQALRNVWAQAMEPQRTMLQTSVVVASSARLAAIAKSLNFTSILLADGTRPEQHMQCLHTWVQQNVRRGDGAP